MQWSVEPHDDIRGSGRREEHESSEPTGGRVHRPAQEVPPTRRLGVYEGRMEMAPDFDAPLPDDLLDAFEGRD